MIIEIFTDGGVSGGNKEDQPCYYSYVATCKGYGELASRSEIGKGTSNQAEYKGLQLALGDLDEMLNTVKGNCEDIVVQIKSDSKIMVNQINGTFKTKDVKLQKEKQLVTNEINDYECSGRVTIEVSHVRRELNPLTDLLCNLAKKNIIKTKPFQTLKEFKEEHKLDKYKALKDV